MKNEKNVILTLSDGNKYIVVESIYLDNINYFYLVDVNNEDNMMFVFEENSNLTKVTDNLLIGKIILEIDKNTNN